MSTARAIDSLVGDAAAVSSLPLVAPKGPRTLADRAFIELHSAILGARLEPGQRLRLDVVANQLGMSVMPVREALRRLEAARLVEVEPHRGATVARLSAVELAEIFELRTVIEAAAIAKGAGAFGKDDATTAEAALHAYAEALRGEDYDEVTETHVRFHLALYRSDRHPWLERTVMPLWETSSRYWNWVKRDGWQFDNLLPSHEELLRLCIARNVTGAVAEIERHLISGRDLLIERVSNAAPIAAVTIH
jgi:DNA-binding GntR family transcriptional regulator